MFGREPNFLHVVKFLRLPGEAIILPLLGKGKREAAPTSALGGGSRSRTETRGGLFGLRKFLKVIASPPSLLGPAKVASHLICIAKPRY